LGTISVIEREIGALWEITIKCFVFLCANWLFTTHQPCVFQIKYLRTIDFYIII